MMGPAFVGFTTGFSLILAIGSQNAFILRQGLLRQHVFWLCLFVALSDALLIAAGVFGFGVIVARYPNFPQLMAYAGAAFLFVYGAQKLLAAVRGQYDFQAARQSTGLWRTLAIAAAFTWLNPHVYLDTVGLIGAISTQYDTNYARYAFGIGAVLSSFVFFFSLGYGARLLSPVMQSARAWRILDTLIWIVMWALAIKLVS